MSTTLKREQYLDLYYYMLLNRSLEEAMVRLFRQNKIVGGLYSSLGQEAISVGTAYALEKRDWMAPMIRNIGALLVKGFRPRDVFTQHMARYTSPTLGKDGTSHFGDLKDKHSIAPISMLGDLVPVLTGIVIGARYLGRDDVALTWIGDGGSSTGVFHEGLNFAAVQRAALILVIENNQWAYSTPVAKQVPIRDLADRAKAYGITSRIVDGNDVLAVYQTTREAVALCRAGNGPVVIEAKTMRMKGHAQHDPADYVPKQMLEYWKARDPIVHYEKFLAASGVLNEKTRKEIAQRIEHLVEEDRQFAENSPFPPPELAEQGVFCEGCHVIQPEWRRPKEELTPPSCSVEPLYQVQDFGALEAPRAMSGDGARTSERVNKTTKTAPRATPKARSTVRGNPERGVKGRK